MNEFFLSRLNTAHALIDEGRYDEAVELLKNLDMRIHDEKTDTKIKTVADDIEKQYVANIISISNKASDPFESFKNALSLKKWRAQQYLRFYDNLLINSEI